MKQQYPRFQFSRASRLSLSYVALAALFTSACQSSSSSQKDAAAPATEAASAEGAEPAEEGAAPASAALDAEPRAAPAKRSEEKQEEPEFKKESKASGASLPATEELGAPPADDLLEREQPSVTVELRLAAEQDAFDAALEPTELSCSGARPHRDAICALAERLCQQRRDAVLDAADQCKAAQEQCDSVRARYREACGG